MRNSLIRGLGGIAAAGGGLPFNPFALPHLEEYYDSRLGFGGYVHNQAVSPWSDFSGNARDQAVNFGPAFYQKTANLSPKGLPRVRFNGLDSSYASGTFAIPVSTRGHTFYFKALMAPTTSPPATFARCIVWYTTIFVSAPKELLTQAPSGGDKWGWRDTVATPLLQPSVYGERTFAWVFEPPNDGTGIAKLYLDGALIDQSTTWQMSAPGNDSTQISHPFLPITGDVDNLLWFSAAHDAATVAREYAWGRTIWGV